MVVLPVILFVAINATALIFAHSPTLFFNTALLFAVSFINAFSAVLILAYVVNLKKDLRTLKHATDGIAKGNAQSLMIENKDLAELAEGVNRVQFSVDDTLGEISRACQMAVRGHLTFQAKAQGDFKDAIHSVNELIKTLHTCFDNIHHPMQVLDKDINVLHFNKTVASYGYGQEYMGKSMAEIYDQNLHDKYVEAYKIINHTRESYVMRTETPTPQGLIIEENCIWPIFSNNEIVAYGNITLDITDKIRFREVSEKIISYQSEGVARITDNLRNELGRGILRFTYKSTPSDNDTASAAATFSQIDETLNHSLAFIADYINEVNAVLSDIAGGDLTSRITREYIGEFASIKDSINNISSSLHRTMSEVVETSTKVLADADQISVSAADLANGVSTQAASIEELNTAMSLISAQTGDNVTNTEEATTLSDKSSQNAKEGNEVMKQLLDAMLQIKESSGNISRIIKVIQDIAFQTNLLALNASVEAARAGDHGRGFAVVADEVRNLASKSQEAANDTTSIIEDSIASVETGSSISQSTADTLEAIVRSADEVSQIISRISESSQEQADAIGLVSNGINQIANVVQDNSDVSAETASAAEDLNSQAKRLQELVSRFKL